MLLVRHDSEWGEGSTHVVKVLSIEVFDFDTLEKNVYGGLNRFSSRRLHRGSVVKVSCDEMSRMREMTAAQAEISRSKSDTRVVEQHCRPTASSALDAVFFVSETRT